MLENSLFRYIFCKQNFLLEFFFFILGHCFDSQAVVLKSMAKMAEKEVSN